MPDPWYPPAIRDPGVNAGYRAGRTSMRLAVCHWTVGIDSRPVGRRGYFTFLVARDGRVFQHAEADALTWHAGTANPYGPGIEVEYYEPHDGPTVFTDAARDATAALVRWLVDEWGIPAVYYSGPRIDPSGFTGFLAHGSVAQPEPHFDYWPQEDWDRMTGDDMPLSDDDVNKVVFGVARYMAGQNPDLNDAGISNLGSLYNHMNDVATLIISRCAGGDGAVDVDALADAVVAKIAEKLR